MMIVSMMLVAVGVIVGGDGARAKAGIRDFRVEQRGALVLRCRVAESDAAVNDGDSGEFQYSLVNLGTTAVGVRPLELPFEYGSNRATHLMVIKDGLPVDGPWGEYDGGVPMLASLQPIRIGPGEAYTGIGDLRNYFDERLPPGAYTISGVWIATIEREKMHEHVAVPIPMMTFRIDSR